MTRIFRLSIMLLCVLLLPGWQSARGDTVVSRQYPSQVQFNFQETVDIAGTVNTVTGAAISPLLVGGSLGAYRYYTTKPELRSRLPWTASPWFWGPLLAVGLLFLFNGLIGRLIPFLARPMDAIESLEGKFALLYASPLVISIASTLVESIEKNRAEAILGSVSSGLQLVAYDNSSAIAVPGIMAWVLYGLILLVALLVFLAVWLLNQAVNTLVLICPVTILGSVLKFLQYGILVLLLVSGAVSPWLGLLVALPVILFAIVVAGWCFRFTTFGTLLAWDVVLFRRGHVSDQPLAFAGSLNRIPVRTLGRLCRSTEGRLEFLYRPWLLLPKRRFPLEDGRCLERNLLSPQLYGTVGGQSECVLLNFPPRYRGAENQLAKALGIPEVRTGTVVRGWDACKIWVGQVMGYHTPAQG